MAAQPAAKTANFFIPFPPEVSSGSSVCGPILPLFAGHLDRRARRQCLTRVSPKPEYIVANRLDLLGFVAAQDVVGTARIKRRHLGARLHRLRILEPEQNPLGIEPTMRKPEVGGPPGGRAFGFLIALLMAAEAVEIVLGHQLGARLQGRIRYQISIQEFVRHLYA